MSESQDFFYSLTPDQVMDSVERTGVRCTGRVHALNSYENRVYEVEIEEERTAFPETVQTLSPIPLKRVVKFYRPGRWKREQIQEEHDFIWDLINLEIPAIPPLRFEDGHTLHQTPVGGIFFAVFPKVGGRSPSEMDTDQLHQVGRLLARIHQVGTTRESLHRLRLTPDTFGLQNLAFLRQGGWLPAHVETHYSKIVEQICAASEPGFSAARAIRLHGDCHLGNLLWNRDQAFFLDFDDMVVGPAIQDLWLLVPGCHTIADEPLRDLVDGYEELRDLDRMELRLIDALRALRIVHFSAWIARRWGDPAFPAAFPQFNTDSYWNDEMRQLENLLSSLQKTGVTF